MISIKTFHKKLIFALYLIRYVRKEVPFYIEASKGIGRACMDSLVQLPRILCQEEKEAYSKTMEDLDLITKLHNVSGEQYILVNLFTEN